MVDPPISGSVVQPSLVADTNGIVGSDTPEYDCPVAPPCGGAMGQPPDPLFSGPLLRPSEGDCVVSPPTSGSAVQPPLIADIRDIVGNDLPKRSCPVVPSRGGSAGQPSFAHKKGFSLKNRTADEIVIAHLNVRSLTSKVDELHYILKKLRIDVLCVSETWLDSEIGEQSVQIPAFHFYRKDRKDKLGGGVGIYVRDGLDFKPAKKLNNDFDVESYWGILKFKKNEFLVCSMYRPPSADTDYFDDILDQIEASIELCPKQVILGDLNYDYVFDDDLFKNPIHLIEQYYNMNQLIQEPTRVTENTSSLIDVILTSDKSMHTRSGVCKLSLSDHDLVFTSIKVEERENNRENNHFEVKFRDYRKFDQTMFLNDVKHSFQDKKYNCDEWVDTFNAICDSHAPIGNKRIKKDADPWIDNELSKKTI